MSILQQYYTFFINNSLKENLEKYHVMPVLWLSCIVGIVFFVPKMHNMGKFCIKDKIYFDALICAIIVIGSRNMAAFLIYDFGESPYDLSASGISNNIFNMLPPLIVRELVRSYTINTYCKKNNKVFFYLLSIILVVFDFNWNSINTVEDLKTFTSFLAEDIAPPFCESILLSNLALYGGASATLVFVVLSFVFHWIIPILPVLNWLSEGVIGTVIPLLEVSTILNKYKPINYHLRKKDLNTKEVINMGITMTFSVLLIWFVVGVFPIYPSVIATGSMEPLIYPGDIILIDKVQNESDILNLKIGDVIQFKRDDIVITHRILEIQKDKDGNISFHTKGDNNTGDDTREVLPQDIKGTLLKVVPKLGYPTLWIKERQKLNRDDIEF
jgi:signal peptidase